MEELLQPLSYWGALFGLVPSWNVFSPIREQPKFHRSLFWWCVCVFILQVVQGIRHLYLSASAYQNGDLSLFPAPFVVFVFVMTGLCVAFNFVPRLPFIHQKKLALGSKKIKQFDFIFNELEDDFQAEKLRRRLRQTSMFGAVWIILAAFGTIFPSIHTRTGRLSSVHQLVKFAFMQLIQIVCFVHGVIAFSIFYMINTIIAVRLKVITKAFRNLVPTYDSDTLGHQKTKTIPNRVEESRTVCLNFSSFEDLDRIRKGFHTLYEASTYFNEACSLAVLLSLCCKLFMCSFSLFVLIYALIAWPESAAVQMITFASVMFLSDLSFFLIILSSASKPIEQWRSLLTTVSQSRTLNLCTEDRAEVLVFTQQIRHSSFCLSPAGMFQVGMHLIPGISASVLTYIIVMLQSTIQDVGSPLKFNYTNALNCSG